MAVSSWWVQVCIGPILWHLPDEYNSLEFLMISFSTLGRFGLRQSVQAISRTLGAQPSPYSATHDMLRICKGSKDRRVSLTTKSLENPVNGEPK